MFGEYPSRILDRRKSLRDFGIGYIYGTKISHGKLVAPSDSNIETEWVEGNIKIHVVLSPNDFQTLRIQGLVSYQLCQHVGAAWMRGGFVHCVWFDDF